MTFQIEVAARRFDSPDFVIPGEAAYEISPPACGEFPSLNESLSPGRWIVQIQPTSEPILDSF
jgi:hypothetical protein